MQVAKDELPEANSAEIEQIAPVIEKKDSPIENNESHQNGGEAQMITKLRVSQQANIWKSKSQKISSAVFHKWNFAWKTNQ